MSWFEKHPNWTMLLGWLLLWVAYKPTNTLVSQWIFDASLLLPADASLHLPIHYDLLDVIIFLVDYTSLLFISLLMLITVWGLRAKDRSTLWALLHFVPIGSLVILLLKNKSKKV